MSKINLITIVIISLIIGLGGGYILGLIQQEGEEGVVTLPETKIIQDWIATARGEVTEISDRTLTLSSDDDVLSIPIEEKARVSKVVLNQETREAEEQEIKFGDIKIGDEVNISLRLSADGELEGTNVIVFPRAISTPGASEQTPEKLEADSAFIDWLNGSLKAEFLPPELALISGVDVGGGITRDKNTYGYNWNYLEKNFYTAVDYNNEKSGINSYILEIFWDEKINLDQEIALGLLGNYFNLPIPDLKCETKEIGLGVIDSCQGSWQDQEENWQNLSAMSQHQGERDYIFLIYYLTPKGSETYKEGPF